MTYTPDNAATQQPQQTTPTYTKAISVHDPISGEWFTSPLNDEAANLLLKGYSNHIQEASRLDFESSDMKDQSKIYVLSN